MIPGPDIIITCPKCEALSRVPSLTSGNTFGAELWTDGKVIAPSMRVAPRITRCHQCDGFFWIEDATEAGQIYFFSKDGDVPRSWREAREITILTETQLLDALDEGLGDTPSREYQLRIDAWWAFNDSQRGSDQAGHAPVDRESRRGKNMTRLSEFDTGDGFEDSFDKAEIARQFGDFEGAIRILDAINVSPILNRRDYVRKLCLEQSTTVAKIPPE